MSKFLLVAIITTKIKAIFKELVYVQTFRSELSSIPLKLQQIVPREVPH
jgi:hypothetical protein